MPIWSSRTNAAFSEVVQGAAKVGDLLGEIATASTEQAKGIDQITAAVADMDKVTQQTAASAEESASASVEMNAQAEQMNRMLGELVRVVAGHSKTDTVPADAPDTEAIAISPEDLQLSPDTGTAEHLTIAPDQVIPMDTEDFKDF